MHFLFFPFVDGNGEILIIPMTLIRSLKIDFDDGTRLVFQYTQSREAIPFMSGFEYGCSFSDRLHRRRLVPGWRIGGADFCINDYHALRVAALER